MVLKAPRCAYLDEILQRAVRLGQGLALRLGLGARILQLLDLGRVGLRGRLGLPQVLQAAVECRVGSEIAGKMAEHMELRGQSGRLHFLRSSTYFLARVATAARLKRSLAILRRMPRIFSFVSCSSLARSSLERISSCSACDRFVTRASAESSSRWSAVTYGVECEG